MSTSFTCGCHVRLAIVTYDYSRRRIHTGEQKCRIPSVRSVWPVSVGGPGSEIASRVAILFLLTVHVAVTSETSCFPWQCRCSSDTWRHFFLFFSFLFFLHPLLSNRASKLAERVEGNATRFYVHSCVLEIFPCFPRYFTRTAGVKTLFQFPKRLQNASSVKMKIQCFGMFVLRSASTAVMLWNI